MLEKAVTDLRDKIAIRGFPRSSVDAEIVRLKEPYKVSIYLYINTGEPERIKKINIFGDGQEVKNVMKLSEGDIYDQSKLKNDIDRIRAYYKNRGYFNPVVGPYFFVNGTLDISVNPGKRLNINIIGNDEISKKDLLREMPFFEIEDFSESIVEEAVHRMLSVYHKEGYCFAQIAPVITTKDNLIELNFFLFEGLQIEINKISFSGNTLPEKKLKEIMFLKEGDIYNPDIIDTDRDALKSFYYSLGYLSADVEEFGTEYKEGFDEININIRINEGLKTEIEGINIVGADFIPEDEISKAIRIKPGDAFNDVDISDARLRIIDLYNKSGFIDAVVMVKREIVEQKATITFQIDEGSETLFGKTIITGNYDTKYVVIKRELQEKEDMSFDTSIINKERHNLYKLGLFTSVEMKSLDKYDHKKDVLVELQEGNAGTVELGVGYGEYEQYRGYLDISYRNLWGMNRQPSLRFELSSLESRYILQYIEPWFLNTPLQFRTYLLHENKREISIDTGETRYRLTRNTATAGFEKKISEVLTSELYYEFSIVNTYDVKPDVILTKEDTGTLAISGIRLGITHDTRDNPFYPRKGTLTGMSIKFTSPVFLSETNFIKFMLYDNFYYELFRGVVIAMSLRSGIAQGYLDTYELPLVERFFLGGRTTVRGYEQDTLGPKGSDGTPTGGNVFLMENLEIRTSIGKGIGFVVFLDGGNVWVKLNDVNIEDFKFTTGIGLRYETPVGPVRLDYGHKLQREEDESSGELHFSIGHAF